MPDIRRHVAQLIGATALVVGAHAGTATAAPCVSASISSYLSSAGCQVDLLGFSAFAVEPFAGATAQLDPADLLLSPIAGGFALTASGPLTASAGDLLGLRLLFRVDAGAPLLTGATVALGAAASASGDGVVTGLLDAGAYGNAIALVADGIADTPMSFAAAPAGSFFDVFFELGIDGGTAGLARLGPDLGRITFVADAVNPVAEPGSASLVMVALFALPLAARRLRVSPKL